MFFLYHEGVQIKLKTGIGPWPLISRTLSSTQLSLHFFPLPAETTTGRSGCYPSDSPSLHGCSWGVWLQLLCLKSQGLKLLSYLPVSEALPASPDVQPHPLVVKAAHRLYQTTASGWEETAGNDKGALVLTWAPPAWSTKKTRPHRERCCFEPTEQLKTSPFSITMF